MNEVSKVRGMSFLLVQYVFLWDMLQLTDSVDVVFLLVISVYYSDDGYGIIFVSNCREGQHQSGPTDFAIL